ncbi:Mu transposase C-terminal domain-containing protein [Jiella pacifica]|uniref:DDE-type integrase/transposase/recombinase n=1 Tax=Jiella pacifica TaxID=2696469 RepID=A0A6N9T6M8_9HYPH|nr:DDE-type integrase/transposase/recombinase [Jiella pacifica]NDW05865.1 DDE-type integrase/transposase/recombinase [Jiella pacifica]
MTRYRLCEDDRILVDGVPHRFVETVEIAQILIDLDRRETVAIEHLEFERRLHAGEIRIDLGYHSVSATRSRVRRYQALSELPPEKRALVMHKLRWVQDFIALYERGEAKKTSPDGYAAAIAMIEKSRQAAEIEEAEDRRRKPGARPLSGFSNPSASQLKRWVLAYEYGDRETMSLYDGYARGGNRQRRLDPVVVRLINRVAARYCTPIRPTMTQLHSLLGRMLRRYNSKYKRDYEIPSRKALERAIHAIPDFEKVAGRRGLAYARKHFAPVHEGVVATMPFERVEMDEWKISIQAILMETGDWEQLSEDARKAIGRTRCWLTAAIDCATRCIVSLHVSNQPLSSATAIRGLRMMMEDKEPLRNLAGAKTEWPTRGTPALLVTDKGSQFLSDEFQTIVGSLDISHARPPAGMATMRGQIERFFGTLETRFASNFIGRTFSNPTQKGEHDAEKLAELTVHELEQALIRHVCDVYHRTPHGALEGLSPAQEWNRLMHATGVKPFVDERKTRIVFGLHVTRSMSARGVRLFGTFYQSEPLHAMWMEREGRRVRIALDPDDLNTIAVERGPGDWIEAEVINRPKFVVSTDTLAMNFAQLVARGLPAFNVDDLVENQRILDEALGDIEAMANAARRRNGIVIEEAFEKGLEDLRRNVRRAFADYRKRTDGKFREIKSEAVSLPRRERPREEAHTPPAETPTAIDQPNAPTSRRAPRTSAPWRE